MFNQLVDNHRQTVAALEALIAALQDDPAISAEAITRLRGRFGAVATQQLRAMESHIVRPLQETGLIETLPEIRAIMRNQREEWATYSANIREWTLKAIIADRAGYLRHVRQRLEMLKCWGLIEQDALYRPALAALAAHGWKH